MPVASVSVINKWLSSSNSSNSSYRILLVDPIRKVDHRSIQMPINHLSIVWRSLHLGTQKDHPQECEKFIEVAS